MTTKVAETQLWQQNLASLIRSGLFSRAATGELNGLFTVVGIYADADLFGAAGQVLGSEAGHRRGQLWSIGSRWSRARSNRTDRIAARIIDVRLTIMASRRMRTEAMVFFEMRSDTPIRGRPSTTRAARRSIRQEARPRVMDVTGWRRTWSVLLVVADDRVLGRFLAG